MTAPGDDAVFDGSGDEAYDPDQIERGKDAFPPFPVKAFQIFFFQLRIVPEKRSGREHEEKRYHRKMSPVPVRTERRQREMIPSRDDFKLPDHMVENNEQRRKSANKVKFQESFFFHRIHHRKFY